MNLRDPWFNYLESFGFNLFLSLTFAPHSEWVTEAKRAFEVQKQYFGLFPVPIKYFSIAERQGRDDCHLHTLVRTPDALSKELKRAWVYGKATADPCTAERLLYCAKKLQKDSVEFETNLDRQSY